MVLAPPTHTAIPRPLPAPPKSAYQRALTGAAHEDISYQSLESKHPSPMVTHTRYRPTRISATLGHSNTPLRTLGPPRWRIRRNCSESPLSLARPQPCHVGVQPSPGKSRDSQNSAAGARPTESRFDSSRFKGVVGQQPSQKSCPCTARVRRRSTEKDNCVMSCRYLFAMEFDSNLSAAFMTLCIIHWF